MKKFKFHIFSKVMGKMGKIKVTPVMVLFMIISSVAFSQGKKIVYFDKDWEKVTSKDSAYYYRKAYFDEYGNELGKVLDYSISGKLIMDGNFTDRGVRNGDFFAVFGMLPWLCLFGQPAMG